MRHLGGWLLAAAAVAVLLVESLLAVAMIGVLSNGTWPIALILLYLKP
jgi:hypothetical protein